MVFPSALFDTAKIFAILVASKPRPVSVIQGCRFPKMLAFQQTHRASPESPFFFSAEISDVGMGQNAGLMVIYWWLNGILWDITLW